MDTKVGVAMQQGSPDSLSPCVQVECTAKFNFQTIHALQHLLSKHTNLWDCHHAICMHPVMSVINP